MTAKAKMNTRGTFDDKKKTEYQFFSAARNGRLKEVIELSSLFHNNVDVLSTALTESCRWKSHMKVVKWLLGNTAADANYNRRGWTSLTTACSNDRLNIAKYLVETGHADVNLTDSTGDTPLTRACSWTSLSVSRYLLCEINDLDVNITDSVGNTALHYAVWCSRVDFTQLNEACEDGDVTEVRRLVYARSHEINLQNNSGDTPLHRACKNGYGNIVEALMLAGANETITNDEWETPAQVAVNEGHSELLALLDRDSLWQLIIWRRQKLKLSIVLLVMLAMKLMRP